MEETCLLSMRCPVYRRRDSNPGFCSELETLVGDDKGKGASGDPRGRKYRCAVKKSWVVAVNTPLSDKISLYKLKPCDWKGLLELIERIRKRVSEELKKPVEVISCYEAGYDGFWLHRVLEAHGVHNHVIDPASLQVDRRARRAKTDGIDVGKLLRSLMANLRGEPKVWSVVRVTNVIEEDNRRLHRERSRLINERIQHVNRIKGLLAIHGIYDYEPMHPERIQRLERLRTADRHTLPL